ncbi:MAG: aldehyde dehydrogenase family protein [Nitriliruptoraceae bacterium]
MGHPRDTFDDTDIPTLATIGVDRWAATDVAGRRQLLSELRRSVFDAAPGWVAGAAALKQLPTDGPGAGEEWINGPVPVLRSLQAWSVTFDQIATRGHVVPPAMRRRADGRVFIDVLPGLSSDKVLFAGFSAQVRLLDDAGIDASGRHPPSTYDPARQAAGPALVLGAGNVTSVGVIDVIDQLFGHGRPVLFKVSDVFTSLVDHFAAALAPVIDLGVVQIAVGGRELGQQLVDNPLFEAIHLTGAAATRQAVVQQVNERASKNATRQGPQMPKVTAEVGGVTPIIVVPGPWHRRDIAWQGANIAAMIANNGGFNCVAGRVLVQHRAWSQRAQLLDKIRASLDESPARYPFHPGAGQRWRDAVTNRTCDHLGAGQDVDGASPRLPYSLITGIGVDDPLLGHDVFCSVVGEVALDTLRSVPEFVDEAVDLCNDQMEGSLAAVLIVHPRSLTDAAVAAAVDRAIENLNYGTVMINHFPGVGFGLMTTPWGSYDDDEWAHNTFMLDRVEKSVVKGPFRPVAKPPWMHDHRTLRHLGPALARYLATDDAKALPRIAWSVLRA